VNGELVRPPVGLFVSDDHDSGLIDRALALGWRLLDSVETFALSLELPDLGSIDLPPSIGSTTDRSFLRTLAPLYLAAELEMAQLLPVVEVLSALYHGGGLETDVGSAGPMLLTFWKNRNERFTSQERQALFARLFEISNGPALAGHGRPNTGFEGLMINLCEALYRLADPMRGTGPSSRVTVGMAARSLAANLLPRAGGITAYAGASLLTSIAQGIEILKVPALQFGFGSQSVWGVVRTVATRLGHETDIGSHVTRGKSGQQVLAWLAEASSDLENPMPNQEVITAATAWLEASLMIAEASTPASRQGSNP
jgi:hypothetical protein